MKYPIVYMRGSGLVEKNNIKQILEQMNITEYNVNMMNLESNINDILGYDKTLLDEEYLVILNGSNCCNKKNR